MTKRNITIACALAAVAAACVAAPAVLNRGHDRLFDAYAVAGCDAQRAERARAFRDGLLARVPGEHHDALDGLAAHLTRMALLYDDGAMTGAVQASMRLTLDALAIAAVDDLRQRGVISRPAGGALDAATQLPLLLAELGLRQAVVQAQVSAVPCAMAD